MSEKIPEIPQIEKIAIARGYSSVEKMLLEFWENRGMSLREISEKLNISHEYIRQTGKELGIDFSFENKMNSLRKELAREGHPSFAHYFGSYPNNSIKKFAIDLGLSVQKVTELYEKEIKKLEREF